MSKAVACGGRVVFHGSLAVRFTGVRAVVCSNEAVAFGTNIGAFDSIDEFGEAVMTSLINLERCVEVSGDARDEVDRNKEEAEKASWDADHGAGQATGAFRTAFAGAFEVQNKKMENGAAIASKRVITLC